MADNTKTKATPLTDDEVTAFEMDMRLFASEDGSDDFSSESCQNICDTFPRIVAELREYREGGRGDITTRRLIAEIVADDVEAVRALAARAWAEYVREVPEGEDKPRWIWFADHDKEQRGFAAWCAAYAAGRASLEESQ
jgi:hypothetical protein